MGVYVDVQAVSLQAKYPLVKYTDMTAEVREEALDICITAVEKYATDMEKCTQVGSRHFAACRIE
jgi:dynein light chain 4